MQRDGDLAENRAVELADTIDVDRGGDEVREREECENRRIAAANRKKRVVRATKKEEEDESDEEFTIESEESAQKRYHKKSSVKRPIEQRGERQSKRKR